MVYSFSDTLGPRYSGRHGLRLQRFRYALDAETGRFVGFVLLEVQVNGEVQEPRESVAVFLGLFLERFVALARNPDRN